MSQLLSTKEADKQTSVDTANPAFVASSSSCDHGVYVIYAYYSEMSKISSISYKCPQRLGHTGAPDV